MLRGIRQASSNWLGRIVMAVVLGLIAVSFAIWGIGDIFRGFGRSTVAKIGSTEITVEQFRTIYNERLQQLGRQSGRAITPDLARTLGLDRQLLGSLLSEAALDERARQMRLNLADKEIARQIMTTPTFLNASGQFDNVRFQQMIRSAGYTEARYTMEQRRDTLRREIAATVGGEVVVPKTIAQAFNRYQNEQRAIDYVMLDRSKAGDIPAPTTEVLAKFFEERKALFRAPEYRSIVLLVLSPAALAKPAEVSDADAEKFYNDNRGRYGTPERRQVQQIVFPNAEEARAAAERLEKGEVAFAALATARGLTDKDIDLGLVAKAGLVDKAIADAAFALKEGGVSAPVQGRFGVALVHVAKIEPENIKPFADVAAEIKQQIALDRARAEIATRHDKIEDERAGGAQLAEIAPKLGLTARAIPAIDSAGRDPAGKPVGDLPAGVDVVASAFKSQVGVENDPLQVTGGTFVWYEVAGVTPTRERTLDEVKAEVESRWREEQVAERLKAKATELLEKLKGGTSLADVAAAEKLKAETAFGLTRRQPSTVLSPKVIDTLFRTAKGDPNLAEGRSPTEWVVFRLTDITVPNLDPASPEGKRVEEALQRAIGEELLGQFVLRLQTDYGTTINADALSRVAGGQQN